MPNTDKTSYQGFPYLTFIEKNIREELDKRQSIDNRIRNINAWAKITSGVYATKSVPKKKKPDITLGPGGLDPKFWDSSEDQKLSQNPRFWDSSDDQKPGNDNESETETQIDSELRTLSTFALPNNIMPNQVSYDAIYDSANRPLPGITSLNVEYKSKYGGVRLAKIQWRTNTLDQLQEFAPYFMVPGRTILIEWGWSNPDTYALTKEQYTELKDNKSKTAWKYFYNRTLNSNGLYDGMLGIVTNYNFSLIENGGYECTLEVISQGSIMYGLNLIHQSNMKNADDKDDGKYQMTIYDFVSKKLEDVVQHWAIDGKIQTTLLDKIGGLKNISNDVAVYIDEKATASTKNKFVTWGFIEDIIVTPFIGIQYEDKELTFKLKSIDEDDLSTIQPVIDDASDSNRKSIDKPGDIQYRSVKGSLHPYLRSTDLSVCFLNFHDNGLLKIHSPADDQVDTKPEDIDVAYLRNIYVNLEVVKDAFLNSDTVTDALLSILNKINAACIQYWDFNIKINEPNQEMRIIDANFIDGKFKELLQKSEEDEGVLKDVYLFRFYGGNGTLKSLNIDSKLSNDMTMTALYGLNKTDGDKYIYNNDNDSFMSLWNDGQRYRDYFIDALYYRSVDVDQNYDTSNTNDNTPRSISQEAYNEGFSDTLKKLLPKLYVDLSEKFGEQDDVALMKRLVYGANDAPTQQNNKSVLLIPIDFDMDIEGISGIRIGDVFLVDVLPDIYLENALLQITGIDHTVENNYWTTKIKALLKVSDHQISSKKIRSRRTGINKGKIEPFDNPQFTGKVDNEVLKWIKREMGPMIRKEIQGTSFTEAEIAGIIYNEAGGIIKRIGVKLNKDAAFVNKSIKNQDARNPKIYAYSMFQFTETKIDTDIEEWVQSGRWTRPNEATYWAIQLLKRKETHIKNNLDLSSDDLKFATLSSYNTGQGNVVKSIKAGRSSDSTTTGGNYAAKVIATAQKYREIT